MSRHHGQPQQRTGLMKATLLGITVHFTQLDLWYRKSKWKTIREQPQGVKAKETKGRLFNRKMWPLKIRQIQLWNFSD